MKRKNLLFFLTLFYTTLLVCQNKISTTSNLEKDTYNWFDSIIGQKNSELSLGPKFFNQIRTINDNHQYYISKKFQTGEITFNEQPYYNVKMKYDIHLDKIIIQLSNKLEKYSLLLETNQIQGFSLENKKFINISNNSNTYGFVEKLKEGKITLYKKHFKKRFKKLDKRFKYSHFKDDSFFLISYKNKLTEIRSKSDLSKQFPSIKKEINKLYRTINLPKNTDLFMIDLITKIELLISNKM